MGSGGGEETHIALVEEHLSIKRREVITDRVRIRTVVDETEVLLEDSVGRGVEVKRIALDREVEATPQAGDVLVVSVVEERAVVMIRPFVVEEIRIRRTGVTEAVVLRVTAQDAYGRRAGRQSPSTEGL